MYVCVRVCDSVGIVVVALVTIIYSTTLSSSPSLIFLSFSLNFSTTLYSFLFTLPPPPSLSPPISPLSTLTLSPTPLLLSHILSLSLSRCQFSTRRLSLLDIRSRVWNFFWILDLRYRPSVRIKFIYFMGYFSIIFSWSYKNVFGVGTGFFGVRPGVWSG